MSWKELYACPAHGSQWQSCGNYAISVNFLQSFFLGGWWGGGWGID